MPRKFAFACLIAAAAPLAAQQPNVDPQALYQRVRERVLAGMVRVPNYTCVQTITRRVSVPVLPETDSVPGKRLMLRPRECAQIISDHDQRQKDLPLESWDRLRLDVGIADKHEVYSWVGASHFEEAGISELVGGGQTNSGDFGSTLLVVFSDHPAMHFQGETQVGGRRLFEYTYETPVEMSSYTVRYGGVGQYTTAYRGSVFLDPEASDVVRVTEHSAELPSAIGYCQVIRELDYGRVRIGADDALLPRETHTTAVDREGGERLNVNSYDRCREYTGESVIRFDDADANETATARGAQTAQESKPAAIPSALMFECRIVTPIDSDRSAAGDPVEAVLRSPLRDWNRKVLAPAGTRIHGRLARFTALSATRTAKASFEVGIQFHSIDLRKAAVPFAANLAKVHVRGAIETNLPKQIGVATFYERELHLKQFDTTWMTARPSP